MSDEAFVNWGWRLPFIASIVLIGISLYVQLRMEDTEANITRRYRRLRQRVAAHSAVTKWYDFF